MTLLRAATLDMGLLYAGKVSAVLVGFIFLPFYRHVLGAEQFGIVAVILSLQSLLIMLDLGMSTLVGRDIAVADSTAEELASLVRTAEVSLTGFYLLLLPLAICLKIVGAFPYIGWTTIIGTIALFWVLVLQNMYYGAMLARREYAAASTIQLVGVAARASVTAYVLATISSTMTAFIVTQLLFATVQALVTRYRCFAYWSDGSSRRSLLANTKFRDAWELVKKGRALVLFSAAGAAVTQLDKPLVSGLISANSVSPYFLAATVCMVPLSLLGGPVSQYFQPRVLNQTISGPDFPKATIQKFVLCTILITSLPCLVFWLARDPLISLWVGHGQDNGIISHYVKILLPGFVVGAFGYIPYTLLLYAKDFRFQAVASIAMSIVTLALTALAAYHQSVDSVCYIYAAYHTTSTLVSWTRALALEKVRDAASYSAVLTLQLVVPLVAIAILAQFLIQNS
ncbi:lipopolysaccharide biosynthesis protein [Cupriavidus taiwanensis]|uniref:O-antigen transporter n=1 Tax=Cupriavidus taiwanensis (strain DSM 17343 / BCRC 17206 / CCUG 44338 / CIP 107171 / LMG 19424 / R1) TaxID=977880 RepID=B3R5Z1_CUPTR|nr:oligosaccharide flippase family protein [Cupriavidus taiwanensis]CAQ70307.1 Putative O-antigen transporter [Cupriavidus taiwanensis LMG 19424]